MIFTTSVNNNYLPKARTIAQSVKQFYPDAKFVLCLVERNKDEINNMPEFDDVVIPSEVWPQSHEAVLYKYDVVEACTAIKGALFSHLMTKNPKEELFIYMDPDTLITSPMDELLAGLAQHEIVLTPHLTEPETTPEAILDNEISVARHGVFNLGFLAIRRGANSIKFINWWADRLREYSYADYYNGLFTDQKWVDQAPAFFEVFILKHPGYNVAPWNIAKRRIEKLADAYTVNINYALRFFHFSGLDSGANIAMLDKYASPSSAVFELRSHYLRLLEQNGETPGVRGLWSYDINSTNSKLIKKSKRAYQRHQPIKRPYEEMPVLAPLIFHFKKRLLKALRVFLRD